MLNQERKNYFPVSPSNLKIDRTFYYLSMWSIKILTFYFEELIIITILAITFKSEAVIILIFGV